MTKSFLARLSTILLAAALAAAPRPSAAEPADATAAPPTAAAAAAPAAAAATAFPSRDFLTGSWGGARDSMKSAGVSVNLNYSTETMGNVSGGEQIGWAYATTSPSNSGSTWTG